MSDREKHYFWDCELMYNEEMIQWCVEKRAEGYSFLQISRALPYTESQVRTSFEKLGLQTSTQKSRQPALKYEGRYKLLSSERLKYLHDEIPYLQARTSTKMFEEGKDKYHFKYLAQRLRAHVEEMKLLEMQEQHYTEIRSYLNGLHKEESE